MKLIRIRDFYCNLDAITQIEIFNKSDKIEICRLHFNDPSQTIEIRIDSNFETKDPNIHKTLAYIKAYIKENICPVS